MWPTLASARALTACATPFGNAPLNPPITPEYVTQLAPLRHSAGDNVIAASPSGGGMRAVAFALDALQALAGPLEDGTRSEIFDDLRFISSVSGSSLTSTASA